VFITVCHQQPFSAPNQDKPGAAPPSPPQNVFKLISRCCFWLSNCSNFFDYIPEKFLRAVESGAG
jgi:hypothetical protein